MTVKELIQKLSELDPDLHVFTHGYEGGFNDIEISEPKDISLNVHEHWWYGKHEEAILTRDHSQIVKGIVL